MLQVSGSLKVTKFGAKGDGATNDQPSIQAAIDYSISTGSPFNPVYLPAGNYFIESEIDRSGTGVYVDIHGDGRRNTIITANAVMDSMIKLSVAGNITGRTTVKDVTLRCASLAAYGINAQDMRYWTLTNTGITGATTACIITGNWLTRILNNSFEDSPTGVLVKGIDTNVTATNNLIVENNSFTTCEVGLEAFYYVNDLNILGNAFDLCDKAGIYIAKGEQGLTIENNYFRRGGVTFLDVETSAGVFVNRLAAIVLGFNYTTTAHTFVGAVENNFFANCNASRFIDVWNIEYCTVDNNKVHGTYATLALVEVKGLGCPTTTCRLLSVVGGYNTTAVNKLIALNGDSQRDSHCNIHADNYSKAPTSRALFAVNNPASIGAWANNTNVVASNYKDSYENYLFDAVTAGTRVDTDLDIVLDAGHPLLGRYLRIHYLTKGDGVANSGVWSYIYVDGVEQWSSSQTSLAYSERGRGSVVYVPPTATTVRIRLRNVSTTVNANIYGFCVCDAGIPLNAVPIKRPY